MATKLTYAQLEGVWIAAGGDPSAAATMAAIAYPESGANPASIQAGQPYATTGWGLWQITPGNSVPSVGINNALLDPITNARAAVAKYNASKKARGNGFLPWTTYTAGLYKRYLQTGIAPSLAGLSSVSPADAAAVAAGASAAATNSNSIEQGALNTVNGINSFVGSGTAGDPCLIAFPGIDIPVVGTVGNFCLFTKTEARALIGGLLMGAGSLIGVLAVITLLRGADAIGPSLSAVGGAPKLPQRRQKDAPETEAETEAATVPSAATTPTPAATSGTLNNPTMANEYTPKKGVLLKPVRKPSATRKSAVRKSVGGKGVLKAAVVA